MMKHIQKYSKVISGIIVLLVLLQSCTIYRSASATLDEAVASKRKVKIHLISGTRVKYKEVFKKDALYYGIYKRDTIQINPKNIERIRLKNRTLSTIGTVIISGVSALAILTGVALWGLSAGI
ncbi:hypothetical protein [uncultured Kordia sp.]|uniref:hypothetical protein n=1 Tax=uncultured Kordia sp. TaxID=507699 RepID=UPI0026279DC9|nr:hypothetical protein [uncultured Kordia sp.]